MKLSMLSTLISFFLIVILSGCGSKPKPAPKDERVVDSSLPKIVLTQHGVKQGMKSIALEWQTIKDKRVKGIYIYKVALDINRTNVDSSSEYLDTIPNRFATHYLDMDVKPDSRYSYYFKTYSTNAEGLKSKVVVVKTKPILNSVTWIHAAENMPRSAKIIWRPHINKLVYAYQIERRSLEEKEWKIVAKLDGRLRAEYIDEDLKNKYTYIYRVRALTYNNIVSKPSKEVRVTTKALPKEVTDIKATDNKARMIVIRWKKTSIEDFLHYNIYRSTKVDSGYKLLAQTKKNTYVDAIAKDGAEYFYRVSTVDKDELESNYENYSAKGVTLVKPLAPALVEAKIVDNAIVLKWSKSDDRTISYIVSKRYKKSMFDEVIEEFDGITNTSFQDTKIQAGVKYFYKVYGVDKNKIRSNESIEVELEIPKIKEV